MNTLRFLILVKQKFDRLLFSTICHGTYPVLWCLSPQVLDQLYLAAPKELYKFSVTLSLPNATVVEFTVHCQTRLQSKFKGTVESCLFLTVIRNATICSLFQNVQGT